MTPSLETAIREGINNFKAGGVPLTSICRLAGVGYFQVYNWYVRRTRMLPTSIAEKVNAILTAKRGIL